MTQDEIIRIAREAGIEIQTNEHSGDNLLYGTVFELERFAALVAEAEGKRLINACEDARFEDGDGQHVEWYKGFDCCAATLNAERIETK